MKKRMLHKKVLALAAGAVLLAFFATPPAFSQNREKAEQTNHYQQGMEYFKQGFYEHAPKGQAAEASKSYGLAVQQFKAAIARDPSHLEAHQNLARVYHVQKNFEGAAEAYKKVTELSPGNLDAYVNQCLALIELKRFDEAIQALENAKNTNTDPKALDTLDKYITKILALQEKEVR